MWPNSGCQAEQNYYKTIVRIRLTEPYFNLVIMLVISLLYIGDPRLKIPSERPQLDRQRIRRIPRSVPRGLCVWNGYLAHRKGQWAPWKMG